MMQTARYGLGIALLLGFTTNVHSWKQVLITYPVETSRSTLGGYRSSIESAVRVPGCCMHRPIVNQSAQGGEILHEFGEHNADYHGYLSWLIRLPKN